MSRLTWFHGFVFPFAEGSWPFLGLILVYRTACDARLCKTSAVDLGSHRRRMNGGKMIMKMIPCSNPFIICMYTTTSEVNRMGGVVALQWWGGVSDFFLLSWENGLLFSSNDRSVCCNSVWAQCSANRHVSMKISYYPLNGKWKSSLQQFYWLWSGWYVIGGGFWIAIFFFMIGNELNSMHFLVCEIWSTAR